MISIREAKELLLKGVFPLNTETIPLGEGRGRILAADILSPVHHPLFNQSAVDGYGLCFTEPGENGNGKKKFYIAGEISAGGNPEIRIGYNEAVRIFTGAPVPEGVDTVVMQEYVSLNDSFIEVQNEFLKKGANIRLEGEQIKEGETALQKGTALSPAAMGFLASLGIYSVEVSCLPDVGIVVTGNEFAVEGEGLEAGKIFESNGIMLKTALKELNIENDYVICRDNEDDLRKVLMDETEKNDIVIVTGGVSVGKYDFTRPALESIGFDIVFHGVAQKPGKPFLFAEKGKKKVFGLPGNPRAVMMCYYLYVCPFIKAAMGCTAPFPVKIMSPLRHSFEKKGDRAFFLSARLNEEGVEVPSGQDSHMLASLSNADAIIFLPGDKKWFDAGEQVETYLLPKI